jgi:hypothetical protein
MSQTLRADVSDLLALADDQARVPDDLADGARAVVQRGALNIKRDWQRRWTGHSHAPALPRAVTYDTTASRTAATAEIGPDKNKPQGALGNLFEYGSVNNAPIPGGAPAAAAEQPRFERAAEQLATEVWDRRR